MNRASRRSQAAQMDQRDRWIAEFEAQLWRGNDMRSLPVGSAPSIPGSQGIGKDKDGFPSTASWRPKRSISGFVHKRLRKERMWSYERSSRRPLLATPHS